MKLIRCIRCWDIFSIPDYKNGWKTCSCKKTGGSYNKDGMTATVGGQAVIFGISNLFFERLYRYLTEDQKRQMRRDHGLNEFTDIWYGGWHGDEQLFYIESPLGPALNVKVTDFSTTHNEITVVDERPFTIGGIKRESIVVPKNETVITSV